MSATGSASRADLVLVTGLSGSGKSTMGHCLEDVGYSVVVNLPIPMLAPFLSDPVGMSGGADRIAVVTDTRTRPAADEVSRLWRELEGSPLGRTHLFLDSTDAALVRRFSETRRPHPLGTEQAVLDQVRRERDLLAGLRAEADIVLDTSEWSVHDIRSFAHRRFGRPSDPEAAMSVTLVSFGFKHGCPPGTDLQFDVRFLPNPHFVPGLRESTGLDRSVTEFLDAQPDFGATIEQFTQLLEFLLPRYRRENRSYLTVGVGCTGGRHRSVAVVERVADALEAGGWRIRRVHHELEREGR